VEAHEDDLQATYDTSKGNHPLPRKAAEPVPLARLFKARIAENGDSHEPRWQ